MMPGMNVESAKPLMEVRAPQLLTFGAVLVLNAFGLLAFFPVLCSFAIVSVLSFGPITFALPALALGLATFCLPFAFGNPYVQWLARKLSRTSAPQNFLVQLTCRPRRADGPRGLLEDADDVGWLGAAGSQLEFNGDSFSLRIPKAHIREIRRHTIGWRGLFLTHRTVVSVAGLEGIDTLEFTERSSWLLPQSRRMGLELHRALEKAIRPA